MSFNIFDILTGNISYPDIQVIRKVTLGVDYGSPLCSDTPVPALQGLSTLGESGQSPPNIGNDCKNPDDYDDDDQIVKSIAMITTRIAKILMKMIKSCGHLVHKSTEEHIISTTENLHNFPKS